MRTLNEIDLKALVSLLNDRNPEVARQCRERIRHEGRAILPALRLLSEKATEKESPDLLAAGAIVHQILVDVVVEEIEAFSAADERLIDLEEGSFLLSRLEYPDLQVVHCRHQLDEIAEELRPRIFSHMDVVDQAMELGSVLGGTHGLNGNTRSYYDPENSFINRVLDSRLGIPISLSAIYMCVARRVGVVLHGVGMPSHFVVQCGNDGDVFLDPFSGGRLLRRQDCIEFLEKAGFGADQVYFEPLSDRLILVRMVANLMHIYRNRGDAERAERYEHVFGLLRGSEYAD